MIKYSLPYPLPLKNPHSPFRNFNYIRPIRIKGTTTPLRDYSVRIVLNNDNFPLEKCKPDGSDIRFRDETGERLPYWIESWNSNTAVVWCRIPFIPAHKTKDIWIIYGNPAATSLSDGYATFDFFDDFSSVCSSNVYFELSDRWTTISGTDYHGFDPVHKTEILEVNKVVDGATRKYLGYDSPAAAYEVRLYYTDDLDGSWTAYSGNPILSGTDHFRIPSVTYHDGTFHMFVNDKANYTVKRYTSTDGISYTYVEDVLTDTGYAYKSNYIWFNPNDNKWYLFWFAREGTSTYKVKARSASTIEDLKNASDVDVWTEVGDPHFSFASIMYRDGAYWLVGESEYAGVWAVRALKSTTSPVSGYVECDNSPILTNDEACPRHAVGPDGVKAYLFISRTKDVWYQDTREAYSSYPKVYAVDWDNKWQSQQHAYYDVVEENSNPVLRLNHVGSGWDEAIYSKNSFPGTKAFKYKVKFSSTDENVYTGLSKDVPFTDWIFLFDAYKGLRYKTSSGSTVVIWNSIVTHKWYDVIAIKKGTNTWHFQLYEEGVLKVNEERSDVTSESSKYFVLLRSDDGDVAYADDFFVRKYVDPEPTVIV